MVVLYRTPDLWPSVITQRIESKTASDSWEASLIPSRRAHTHTHTPVVIPSSTTSPLLWLSDMFIIADLFLAHNRTCFYQSKCNWWCLPRWACAANTTDHVWVYSTVCVRPLLFALCAICGYKVLHKTWLFSIVLFSSFSSVCAVCLGDRPTLSTLCVLSYVERRVDNTKVKEGKHTHTHSTSIIELEGTLFASGWSRPLEERQVCPLRGGDWRRRRRRQCMECKTKGDYWYQPCPQNSLSFHFLGSQCLPLMSLTPRF